MKTVRKHQQLTLPQLSTTKLNNTRANYNEHNDDRLSLYFYIGIGLEEQDKRKLTMDNNMNNHRNNQNNQNQQPAIPNLLQTLPITPRAITIPTTSIDQVTLADIEKGLYLVNLLRIANVNTKASAPAVLKVLMDITQLKAKLESVLNTAEINMILNPLPNAAISTMTQPQPPIVPPVTYMATTQATTPIAYTAPMTVSQPISGHHSSISSLAVDNVANSMFNPTPGITQIRK